jgi:hypothetical protein
MDRDAKTKRLLPDLAKFPKGINGTADTIHNMGLKIGIYSSAGTKTCAGYPASLDYEVIDAQTWADWGVDCKPFRILSVQALTVPWISSMTIAMCPTIAMMNANGVLRTQITIDQMPSIQMAPAMGKPLWQLARFSY